jgi:hypothetical protein
MTLVATKSREVTTVNTDVATGRRWIRRTFVEKVKNAVNGRFKLAKTSADSARFSPSACSAIAALKKIVNPAITQLIRMHDHRNVLRLDSRLRSSASS